MLGGGLAGAIICGRDRADYSCRRVRDGRCVDRLVGACAGVLVVVLAGGRGGGVGVCNDAGESY